MEMDQVAAVIDDDSKKKKKKKVHSWFERIQMIIKLVILASNWLQRSFRLNGRWKRKNRMKIEPTWNTNANIWKAGGTWNNISTIDQVNCHNPVCPINSEMQSPSSSSAPTLRRCDPQLFTLCRGFASVISLTSIVDGDGITLPPFDIFSRKFIKFCQKPYFIVSLAFSSTDSSAVLGAVVVVVVTAADGDTAVVCTDRNSSLARAPMFDVTTFSSVIFLFDRNLHHRVFTALQILCFFYASLFFF